MRGSVERFPMNILQVNTWDLCGGAEKISWTLHHAYQACGHNAWLAVGYRRTQAPNIFLIPQDDCRSPWARFWIAIGRRLSPLSAKFSGIRKIGNVFNFLGQPHRWIPVKLGHEDFDFPGSHHILTLAPQRPDILHCHNLHGNYFDLRLLPRLCRQIPVLLTLHDAWLLSGHCAHAFDCERWKTGCGHCPDLTILPPVQRDATAYNWQRKHRIYAQSKLYVATPSRWLMQKVEQSILQPAVIEGRVIPNGIDLSLFQPGNKQAARQALGIEGTTNMVLFAASTIRQNPWKDYQTMQAAVTLLAERRSNQKLLFIALGDTAPERHVGQAVIRFVPYQQDPQTVVQYYQAADVYIHAAKADTFPNTVLEALACGTPVVATAVGGISEQIEHGQTGFLVPLGDVNAMVVSIQTILDDTTLQNTMSRQAAEIARCKFGLGLMVQDYVEWYQEIFYRGLAGTMT
jgi:glycosyltransferase involved in cell wall biosynthesis